MNFTLSSYALTSPEYLGRVNTPSSYKPSRINFLNCVENTTLPLYLLGTLVTSFKKPTLNVFLVNTTESLNLPSSVIALSGLPFEVTAPTLEPDSNVTY